MSKINGKIKNSGSSKAPKTDPNTEKTKELELQIETLLKERDDLKDKYMRTMAEFENYQKRATKDKADLVKYANEKIIIDLCDVLDCFERALSTDISSQNLPAYTKGVEQIFQQLSNVLKKNDVVKIEVMGKEFDPNFNEALSTIPSDAPKDTIVGVVQNGYMIGSKVLRYSKVVVSNGESIKK